MGKLDINGLHPISRQCSTYGKARWLDFNSKINEKQIWNSDSLSKNAVLDLLFCPCFSHISLVTTDYLVSL